MSTIETKQTLTENTLGKIHELVQINIDSQRGLNEAADRIEDLTVAEMLHELADVRKHNIEELREFFWLNGERPPSTGTYLAALHRIWVDLRAGLNGGDAYVVLCESERSEEQVKQAYESALQETAGSALNDVLLTQYARVKRGRERIGDFRSAYSQA